MLPTSKKQRAQSTATYTISSPAVLVPLHPRTPRPTIIPRLATAVCNQMKARGTYARYMQPGAAQHVSTVLPFA